MIQYGIVQKSITDLENSELYKYSPYKTLNQEQLEAASFRNLKTDPGNICVIEFGGNDCDLDWDAVSQNPDA